MARSLKSQDPGNFETSRYAATARSSTSSGSFARGTEQSAGQFSEDDGRRWEMRLSFAQLMVLWSVIGGTMIMVFLFGLYAGREQGVQSALDGQSAEAVRLPVASPVAVQDAAPSAAEIAALSVPAEAPSANRLSIPSMGTQAAANAADSSAQTAPAAPPAVSEKSAPAAKADSQDAAENAALLAELSQSSGSPSTAQPSTGPAASPPAKLGSQTLAEKEQDKATKDREKAKKPEPEVAKPEVTKSELTKTVKSTQIPAGWYLQVAAARTINEASAVAAKLRSAGLRPVIESAQVNKSTYYRVVLGPYATKEAAAPARKAAMSSNAARGEPFLKQVK